MGSALAHGWGDPVLCADAGSGRAAKLVAELGGEALAPVEVARRADLVVLAHKPAGLRAVAEEIAGSARAVASVLGGVTLSDLHAAYPDRPVIRLMPNTPVAVGRGVTCVAEAPDVSPELLDAVRALFGRLGEVFMLPEAQMEVATAVMGVGPAYVALVAEAQVDAAVRHGLRPSVAGALVAETLAGSAALLRRRNFDTLAVRREVTSPGGSTARGLAALEHGGLRAAFSAATDAVIGGR